MVQNRHVGERTCCGCRTKRQMSEMMAIKRLKDGTIIVSRDGKTAGRGAYLCRNKACIERARGKKGDDAISRSIKAKVSPSLFDDLIKLASQK